MVNKQVYAGIDIGATNIKYGLVAHDGEVLFREKRPAFADKGATPLMYLITNIGERLLLAAAEEEYEVAYLGVGTPGAVDFRTGKVVGPCPNIEGWQGMEIGETLRERLNLPVFVDNDANAMALAEARFGAAAGAGKVICMTVGTGIGGGIIIDGRLYRGANGSAGELGHMSINSEGIVCRCGNIGCLEAYAASPAITARVKSLLREEMTDVFQAVLKGEVEQLTIRKLFVAERKGDRIARKVLDETATYLGIALAGIVNLLNPETVVIGGGIIDGGGGLIGAIAKEIKARAFESAAVDLRVVKAALGNDAGFIGAGLLGEDMK